MFCFCFVFREVLQLRFLLLDVRGRVRVDPRGLRRAQRHGRPGRRPRDHQISGQKHLAKYFERNIEKTETFF